MKTHSVSTKQTIELRLLTATVYFKAVNEVQDALLQIDPLTPVIPITTGTSSAELYADAREHLNNGASQVMIPIISPTNLTLSVVTLGNEEVTELGHSEGQAVHSLLEIRTPKRSWPLSDLYIDDNEGLAQVSRCFARLVG